MSHIPEAMVERWARECAMNSFSARVRGYKGSVGVSWRVKFTLECWRHFVEPMLEDMPHAARNYYKTFLLQRLKEIASSADDV